MHVQNLDTSNPASLEAALDAAPIDTLGRVVTEEGETFHITRVLDGWYVHADVIVTSGDIADGRPRAVSLLMDPNYEEGK